MLEFGENLIVDLTLDSEDSGLYFYDSEVDGWLDSIAPLRNGALAGDLRLFYILWLTAVERGIVPDHAKEPLPGIGPLSAPHKSLTKFFSVDQDLVGAAGESPASGGDSSFADSSQHS